MAEMEVLDFQLCSYQLSSGWKEMPKCLTSKVTGWLEAGEARCKPVPVDRRVMRHFHKHQLACIAQQVLTPEKHLPQSRLRDGVSDTTRVRF